MKLQAFIQASLLFGVFVVGCSGAVTPTTGSESESLAASKPKKDAGQCVSEEDGPCGGFIQNPCTCAAGLVCVANSTPDLPGTCEPNQCCPASWDMYTCNEENGTTGFNCHNPALACASSLTCGGGCDFQVTGRCPVCDPIVCPAGQTFDTTQCKCVPS